MEGRGAKEEAMTPERLAEIEAQNCAHEGRCITDEGAAHVYQVVRELCAALRQAWEDMDISVDVSRGIHKEKEGWKSRALAAEAACASMRAALFDLTALYEEDEGCRTLPPYIAAREALRSNTGKHLLAYLAALEAVAAMRASIIAGRGAPGYQDALAALAEAKKRAGR